MFAPSKLTPIQVRAWVSDGVGEPLTMGRPNTPERDQLPRGRCPRGTCNPFRFLQPFARRLAECYYAIQKEEGVRIVDSNANLTKCGKGCCTWSCIIHAFPTLSCSQAMPMSMYTPFKQCSHYTLHLMTLLQVRNLQYTAVLRVRPDHVFLHVMPPVSPSGWLGALLADG